MATEQAPTNYTIGGQPAVTGYQVIDAVAGLEEDAEQKQDGAGKFNGKIAYGRRATWQLTLEVNHGVTPTYQNGGTIESGVLATAGGDTTAWRIRSATLTKTRGVQVVNLDIIALTDMLA